MIAGIVLAAGRSQRMGRPKAFLQIGGETFLDRLIGALSAGGCEPVVVVTGPADEPVPARVAAAARDAGARVAENPLSASEQVDSVRVGIRSLPAAVRAVVLAPVDVPISGAATVRALVTRFEAGGAGLVVPVASGRRGHPILIRGDLLPELLAQDLPEGVRSLIRAHEHDVAEVPVEDPAVLLDVDTPWDYNQLLDRES